MDGRDCTKCQKSRKGTQGIFANINENETKCNSGILSILKTKNDRGLEQKGNSLSF